MLRMGEKLGLSIAAMKRANKTVGTTDAELDAGLDRISSVMDDCIERGLAAEGTLPGGLKVRRRARAIHQALMAERGSNRAQPHAANDWLSVYAMAVNEENAAGGRIVTAPTNGAAGVVPTRKPR
jgi:L-serine dehydratase